MPAAFQDITMINSIQDKMNLILEKYERIVSCEIFGNLILVLCGRFIKYAFIDPNSTIILGDNLEGLVFKDAKLDFSENVEIHKVVSTSSDNIVQIIAKDNIENILIVPTLDFSKNMEITMY